MSHKQDHKNKKGAVLLSLAPIVACAMGVVASVNSGISVAVFIPNLIGILIGLVFLNTPAIYRRFHKNLRWLSVGAFAILALSLLFEGDQGVRRWIELGPIYLNVSMAFLPLIVFEIYQSKENLSFVMPLCVGTALIFYLQPDGGQSTVFLATLGSIYLFDRATSKLKKALIFIPVAGLTLATWSLEDPLAPVDHVERIFFLMANLGWLGIFIFLVAMLAMVIPLIYPIIKKSGNFALAIVALTYLMTSLTVPEMGNFPVPVIGVGIGPMIGYYFLLVGVFRS